MAPIQKERFSQEPPFTYVAVDHSGAIYLKENSYDPQILGYIVIFSCLSTRAVHLELSLGLNCDLFMEALSRCMSTRGQIKSLFSDSHKTFICADKELKCLFDLVDREEAITRTAGLGITWTFATPEAPWTRAGVERMMRTTKEGLRKVLRKTSLSSWSFYTVMKEVERCINDRPLTTVDNDKSTIIPICPSMLIAGRHLTTLPNVKPAVAGVTGEAREIQKRWKCRQSLAKQAKARFMKDYLLSLQKFSAWRNTCPVGLEIGSVVLVSTQKMSRAAWPLARVIKDDEDRELRSDRLVRSVKLQFQNGTKTRRPIAHLVHLETWT